MTASRIWIPVYTSGASRPGRPLAEGHFAEGRFAEGRFAEGRFAEGRFAEGRFAEGRFAEGLTRCARSEGGL